MCRVALLEFIRQLEVCKSTQSKVDEWYNQFCDMLVVEIDKCKPTMSNHNKVKKRRHSKPYWNSHLKELWNERKKAEMEFLRCNDCVSRQQLRLIGSCFQLLAVWNPQIWARCHLYVTLSKNEKCIKMSNYFLNEDQPVSCNNLNFEGGNPT